MAYLFWLVPISGLVALTLSDRPRKSTFRLGVTTHFVIVLIFGALLLGINIFYTIGLIPTTGITLPFFSDGGSSLIASAMTVGLLLALTRQRRMRP